MVTGFGFSKMGSGPSPAPTPAAPKRHHAAVASIVIDPIPADGALVFFI
jgi:hypothetical protein